MKNLAGEIYQILIVHNINIEERSSIKGAVENLKQENITYLRRKDKNYQ